MLALGPSPLMGEHGAPLTKIPAPYGVFSMVSLQLTTQKVQELLSGV